MKNNNKWKRISSGILAVCLVVSVVMANQSFGVFAEEDGVQVQEQQTENEEKKLTQENYTIVNEIDGNGKENKEKISETYIENNSEGTAGGEKENSILETEEKTAVYSEDTISGLIDADIALLKWKADENTAFTIRVGNNTYTVSDESTYQQAYTAVYSAMEQVATVFSSEENNTDETSKNVAFTEIDNQTVTTDTIWKVSGKVCMNGTVTVASSGRLVILGDGEIDRRGVGKSNDSSIDLKGKLCLQGSVVFDGGGDSYDARFLMAKAPDADNNTEVYLTDNFKIQNCIIKDKNGAGIYGVNTAVYMSGGMIGSDKISFTWDDNLTTKYGEETENYLKNREGNNEYPHLISIASTNGCVAKAVETGKSTNGAGIEMENSAFHMSDGNIVGNILLGTSTVKGSDEKGCHGAGARFEKCEVNITGGKISGNQSNTTSEAKKHYNQYAGAIQLEGSGNCNLTNVEISYNYAQRWVGAIDIYPSNHLVMNEGTVIKYNSAESNCGGIAVDGKGTEMTMNNPQLFRRTGRWYSLPWNAYDECRRNML